MVQAITNLLKSDAFRKFTWSEPGAAQLLHGFLKNTYCLEGRVSKAGRLEAQKGSF